MNYNLAHMRYSKVRMRDSKTCARDNKKPKTSMSPPGLHTSGRIVQNNQDTCEQRTVMYSAEFTNILQFSWESSLPLKTRYKQYEKKQALKCRLVYKKMTNIIYVTQTHLWHDVLF